MNNKLKKEIELIRYVRHSIIDLTDKLSVEQWNEIPDRMKNNLVWNVGHMVFTQQMLCYALGGLQPTIDMAFFGQFAPDTSPGSIVNHDDIARIKSTFSEAFEQLATDATAGRLESYKSWSLPSGISIDSFEDAMITNVIHEGRHFGVVISLAKQVSQGER